MCPDTQKNGRSRKPINRVGIKFKKDKIMKIRIRNLAVFIMMLTAFFSCDNDASELVPQVAEEKATTDQVNALVEEYSLEEKEKFDAFGEIIELNNMTKSELDKIYNAFSSAMYVEYDDFNKKVIFRAEAMGIEEAEETSKKYMQSLRSQDNSPQAKVPVRKIAYDIWMFEHADFDRNSKQLRRQGYKKLKRGEVKEVKVSNVGKAFNDKMTSAIMHVEPLDPKRASVEANLIFYKDDLFRGRMGSFGGRTDYGVGKGQRFSFIHGSVKNMKKFDRQEAIFSIYWYTQYKTHSLNDQLTSWLLTLKRKL